MKIIENVSAMHQSVLKIKKKNQTVGFVPTMGYLHDGHAALLRQCKKENEVSVLSIFVNPAQFGPKEDFKNYPRNIKNDELLAKRENVDIIFYPSVDEIYPSGFLSYVNVDVLSDQLCGASRPGHFRGVATVVLKLINIVGPHVMYLGQKDAQQAVILRKMVEDFNVPVKVKIIPTVRENDGLAMSSRNSYLTEIQRNQAGVLYQALQNAQQKIKNGEKNVKNIISSMKRMIGACSEADIDYIQCVNAMNLSPIRRIEGEVLIALAVKFGKARLIDNVIVHANEN
jgi:pantoate--beta-alanine ligase